MDNNFRFQNLRKGAYDEKNDDSDAGTDDVRHLGVEWATEQCRDLYDHGVRNIHFYTVSAVESVREVAKRLM